MSLVEALDKGCVPLLGTARFLFCGSRFLRVRFFGLPRSKHHARRTMSGMFAVNRKPQKTQVRGKPDPQACSHRN